MRSAVLAFEMPGAGEETFGPENQLIEPGGLAVADWLRGVFAADFEHTGNVEDHEDYGWTFQFMDGDQRVWCLLALGPEIPSTIYFWAEVQPPLVSRLIGKKERTHLDALEIANRVIATDARFANVRIKAPGKPDEA